MDIVGLEGGELLIELVGGVEPVTPVELHGGDAGSRGDLDAVVVIAEPRPCRNPKAVTSASSLVIVVPDSARLTVWRSAARRCCRA